MVSGSEHQKQSPGTVLAGDPWYTQTGGSEGWHCEPVSLELAELGQPPRRQTRAAA